MFFLAWTERGEVRGDTVIVLPSLAFPQGAEVVLLSPQGPYRQQGHKIYVSQLEGGARSIMVRRLASKRASTKKILPLRDMAR